ncbi:hypothetical protein Cgig2_018995 [Carnegiea gigantea]|uniref:Uncharacterized protein n=1 Tax=Carnegiea gigantea TaxID=171969 RepID=A0A9Q1GQY5_9CARY|nr:hypothetical protein Cgig2_018995 [Carnegiea gigantea]
MRGEPNDLGRFQSIMQAIELACCSIQGLKLWCKKISVKGGELIPKVNPDALRISRALSDVMHVNPAAAEATILSLSQYPQPYQACKFILGEYEFFEVAGEGQGARSGHRRVDRKFLSPPSSFVVGFRSPANFPAAGVSTEFPQTIFPGTESPVRSFGGAFVSGQPRVSGVLCNSPRFLLPG